MSAPTHPLTDGPLPDGYARTRTELQRVATHVLARARADHGGRFGLRATPSGLGTPMFGPDETVLRLVGTELVLERQTDAGAVVVVTDLAGRSLADAASSAGVDLSVPFTPGADAPAVGDPQAPLDLDGASCAVLLGWFAFGSQVLDAVLPELDGPTVAQVWPEHFDLGCSATTGSGGVNLGASPGDAGVPEPYLYVAPWESGRPGDPDYWNAPYGAVATRSELAAGDGGAFAAGCAFLRRGLTALDAG